MQSRARTNPSILVSPLVPDNLFFGLDISKDWIDIARADQRKTRRIANTEAAITAWIDTLPSPGQALICFEPTGGYERCLHRLLRQARQQPVRVHPTQVHQFRLLTGTRAKTDPIDAQLLARFAAHMLSLRPPPLDIEAEEQLRGLAARRRQLIALLHAEACRQEHAEADAVTLSHVAVEAALRASLAEIEAAIAAHIAATPELARAARLLRSFKGVGPVTVLTLLADLPELGRLSGKQIAALVGLAPQTRQSGKHKGKARVGFGRPGVRAALFNAARAAIRHNDAMRAFYQRLTTQNGCNGKVALCAVMRKMLVILNAMMRDGTPWSGTEAKTDAAPADTPETADAGQTGPAAAASTCLAAVGPVCPAHAASVEAPVAAVQTKPRSQRKEAGAARQKMRKTSSG
jgi:transposase